MKSPATTSVACATRPPAPARARPLAPCRCTERSAHPEFLHIVTSVTFTGPFGARFSWAHPFQHHLGVLVGRRPTGELTGGHLLRGRTDWTGGEVGQDAVRVQHLPPHRKIGRSHV